MTNSSGAKCINKMLCCKISSFTDKLMPTGQTHIDIQKIVCLFSNVEPNIIQSVDFAKPLDSRLKKCNAHVKT